MDINFEWVSIITSDAMDSYAKYKKIANKKNKDERDESLIISIVHTFDENDKALTAIHAITDLPYEVLYNFVRIERVYEKKNKYEKCLFVGDRDDWRREKLINNLWRNYNYDIYHIAKSGVVW